MDYELTFTHCATAVCSIDQPADRPADQPAPIVYCAACFYCFWILPDLEIFQGLK